MCFKRDRGRPPPALRDHPPAAPRSRRPSRGDPARIPQGIEHIVVLDRKPDEVFTLRGLVRSEDGPRCESADEDLEEGPQTVGIRREPLGSLRLSLARLVEQEHAAPNVGDDLGERQIAGIVPSRRAASISPASRLRTRLASRHGRRRSRGPRADRLNPKLGASRVSHGAPLGFAGRDPAQPCRTVDPAPALRAAVLSVGAWCRTQT